MPAPSGLFYAHAGELLQMSDRDITAPVAKLATVWAAVGVSSWADAAALAAFLYSALLITEWFWKKFWRGILERNGYIKPKRRRRDTDDTERGELE